MPSVSNFKEILLNAIQNNAQNNGAKVSSPERAFNQFSFELPRLCIENKIRGGMTKPKRMGASTDE